MKNKWFQSSKDKVNSIQTNILQTLSTTVNRALLSAKMGKQYGTDRDIYEALGYPTDPEYADFLSRYVRQDIAQAIIDRPVKATWQGPLDLVESSVENETSLEKEWKILSTDLGLKSKFIRLDKLTGIGRYGVMLMGTDDLKTLDNFAEPIKGGKRKLVYVKPLGEGSAKIDTYEARPDNERFGQPLLYNISVGEETVDGGTSAPSGELKVHYTRILHIVDNILESEILGSSRLEVVLNRLFDLEKIVGGDAEMFWRGARPGYEGKVDKDFNMTAETKTGLQDQIEEFEHNLRRILVTEGVDLKALAQQIADPKNHVDIQIQMISAVTGIPKRILTGSERGELSSDQDKTEWNVYVKTRREEYAEIKIVRPFIDWCTLNGILPKSKEEYSIEWEDLFAPSEKEKVEIGKSRSTALKEYTSNPMAEAIIPPAVFLEFFLGFNDAEVEEISKKQLTPMEIEQKFAKDIDIIEE